MRAYDVCSTQWRAGFGGATGLAYEAVLPALGLYLPRWQADAPASDPVQALAMADLLDDVRVIEAATLDAWAEKDEQRRTQSTES